MIQKKICLFILTIFNFLHFNIESTEQKKIKIAFFINRLTVRGVEVATYDYADCNETILGNESIIICNTEFNNSNHDNQGCESAIKKFKDRFQNRYYECSTMVEVDKILQKEKVDIFYVQKGGDFDGKISKVCKNAIHVVFSAYQPHGDVYACISKWLSKYNNPKLNPPYVPYMVRLSDTKEDLRQELSIPKDAIVFGRHGGYDSFDIIFAKEAIIEIAQIRKNCYFLFLNTEKFCNLPNVIFLPANADMIYKTKFINTCDAMLHARLRGETFGLACAEFSIKNKPIITWNGSFDVATLIS